MNIIKRFFTRCRTSCELADDTPDIKIGTWRIRPKKDGTAFRIEVKRKDCVTDEYSGSSNWQIWWMQMGKEWYGTFEEAEIDLPRIKENLGKVKLVP